MDDDVHGSLGSTDGLVTSIYELLWKKKNDRQEKQCKHPGFFVHIPDSIVYNFSQPQTWYFTSLQYRQINKKRRTNLNSRNILDKFLKGKSQSGIVAAYLYNDTATPEGKARVTAGGTSVCIRYLDAEALRSNLLRLGTLADSGILQQFIDPKMGVDGMMHNHTIQAMWQPNHVSFDRRQNKHSLTDTRWSIQQRAETFEGTFQNSASFPLVSAILLDEITKICNGIAEHLWHVADCAVKRMVLNFRIDETNKIWFHYCSHISVIERDTIPRPPMELLQPVTAKESKKRDKHSGYDREAEKITHDHIIKAAHLSITDPDESSASVTRAMLERMENMKVDELVPMSHKGAARRKRGSTKPLPLSSAHLGLSTTQPSTDYFPDFLDEHGEPITLMEKFSDRGWGESAESVKRIVFENAPALSASQR
mmetsp:Transcript_62464/g.111292  ORF Transcript_62464/g.111292 Transcript_62464/m.111292 type:complete len:424 (-) Transcript_62464:77-1348(-)